MPSSHRQIYDALHDFIKKREPSVPSAANSFTQELENNEGLFLLDDNQILDSSKEIESYLDYLITTVQLFLEKDTVDIYASFIKEFKKELSQDFSSSVPSAAQAVVAAAAAAAPAPSPSVPPPAQAAVAATATPPLSPMFKLTRKSDTLYSLTCTTSADATMVQKNLRCLLNALTLEVRQKHSHTNDNLTTPHFGITIHVKKGEHVTYAFSHITPSRLLKEYIPPFHELLNANNKLRHFMFYGENTDYKTLIPTIKKTLGSEEFAIIQSTFDDLVKKHNPNPSISPNPSPPGPATPSIYPSNTPPFPPAPAAAAAAAPEELVRFNHDPQQQLITLSSGQAFSFPQASALSRFVNHFCLNRQTPTISLLFDPYNAPTATSYQSTSAELSATMPSICNELNSKNLCKELLEKPHTFMPNTEKHTSAPPQRKPMRHPKRSADQLPGAAHPIEEQPASNLEEPRTEALVKRQTFTNNHRR